MNEKEKIRAEIERRYKWYQDEITKYMPHMVPDYEAKKEECKSILDFIDSLFKEPVSEGLENEISRYVESDMNHHPDIGEIVKHFRGDTIASIACHFAQWQKEQMMKDAIEIDDKVKIIILKDE